MFLGMIQFFYLILKKHNTAYGSLNFSANFFLQFAFQNWLKYNIYNIEGKRERFENC